MRRRVPPLFAPRLVVPAVLAHSLSRADILSLQHPTRGSFAGDRWGEQASRFTYCAVSCLSLLGRLDALDRDRTVRFIERCRNFDGGFGMVEGAESHAAYGASRAVPARLSETSAAPAWPVREERD